MSKEKAMRSIQGIRYDQIEKLDFLGNGMYKVYKKDGELREVSLDKGQAQSLRMYLNHKIRVKNTDPVPVEITHDIPVAQEEVKKAKKAEPTAQDIQPRKVDFSTLEKNLTSRFDVDFVNPDHVGYWPLVSEAGKFLSRGYEYARPGHIQNFEMQFSDLNPGDGMNPDGHIVRDGHVLMFTTKENQEAIEKYFYDKRPLAQNRREYLSPQQLSRLRAQHGV